MHLTLYCKVAFVELESGCCDVSAVTKFSPWKKVPSNVLEMFFSDCAVIYFMESAPLAEKISTFQQNFETKVLTKF